MLRIVALGLMMALSPFSYEEEIEEPIIVEEEEPVIEEEEQYLDEEGFKEKVSDFLSQYMEQDLVVKIISWLVDAGVLTALFSVYVKYSKFKHKTLEDLVNMVTDESKKFLDEKIANMSEKDIGKITKAIDDLQKSNETIVKALILLQNNTEKGKATLVDFLEMKSTNKETKEIAREVSEQLEQQKIAKEEVQTKVEQDYINLY